MSGKPVLYIAGPMSNLPHFNFPLFHAVAADLRAEGYTIVSPAETDAPDTQIAAMASPDGKVPADGKVGHETWGDMLARDVKMLADGLDEMVPDKDHPGNHKTVTLKIDGLALLPNWQRSRGARLECFVGLLTGKVFFSVQQHLPADLDGAGEANLNRYELSPRTTEWVEHMLAREWNGVRVYRTSEEGPNHE